MSREPVDPARPDAATIDRAARLIRDGRLVAFPTETVYGLGANALDPDAVARVFAAKGRPARNPLIVHVADGAGAREVVREWTDLADRLARAFWPGPLTLVLPRSAGLPEAVTAGLDDVAVRAPDHAVARALIRAAGVPVVAPSANPSTAVSPTSAQHVERGLGGRVDLILDAGPTALGIESTVVSLAGSGPVLLRPGALSAAAIEAITGPLRRAEPGDPASRASPGMMDRHYAPRAALRVFPAGDGRRAEEAARSAAAGGRKVAALAFDPLRGPIHPMVVMPGSPGEYARRLYAEIHRLDELGCGLILVEEVPDAREWDAVRDRLRRAAGESRR